MVLAWNGHFPWSRVSTESDFAAHQWLNEKSSNLVKNEQIASRAKSVFRFEKRWFDDATFTILDSGSGFLTVATMRRINWQWCHNQIIATELVIKGVTIALQKWTDDVLTLILAKSNHLFYVTDWATYFYRFNHSSWNGKSEAWFVTYNIWMSKPCYISLKAKEDYLTRTHFHCINGAHFHIYDRRLAGNETRDK